MKVCTLWELTNKLRLFYILCGILIFNTSSSQNYDFDNWLVRDGLPQNSILKLLQSKDGYIWLATEGGLSRFDGVQFTNYNVVNTKALSSNRINTIIELDNGDLLISSDGKGLTLYRNGQFINLSEKNDYGENTIEYIDQLPSGDLILINGGNNLIFIDGNNYKRLPDKRIEGLDVVPEGIYYGQRLTLLYPSELIIYKEVKGHFYKEFSFHARTNFNNLNFDKHTKDLWLVDGACLRQFRDHKEVDTIDLSNFFPKSSILTLHIQEDYIFISSDKGSKIYSIDKKNNVLELFYEGEICRNGIITSIKTDFEKNIWIATSTCGLIKMRPNRFSYLGNDFAENIYPINKDNQNNILIGTLLNGLVSFNKNGELNSTKYTKEFNNQFVTSIETHQDDVYFSLISRNFIYHINKDKLSKYYYEDSSYFQCNVIYMNSSGKLLVGTKHSLYQLDENKLVKHPLSKLMSFTGISSMMEDKQGKLWIAADDKLICWDLKKEEFVYNSNDQMPDSKFFRGLSQDEEGRVYVGSYGLGLTIVDKDKSHRYTVADGLIENVVSTITEDKRGNIWLTGNRGMSRIKKNNLLNVISGKEKKLNVVLYNEETDRLRNGEFNGGNQQSKCWLGDEVYLFPSISGAVRVDFANMLENKTVPPVHIEMVQYNDSVYSIYKPIEIDYSGERLEIKYTALSFVSPMNVKFKYKLEGYDNEWIDAGSERKTSYVKIPPGDYTFKVIASNNEGVWNEIGDQISIKIIPPFYMTRWFQVIIIILSLTITVLIVLYATLKTRRKEKDKSALLDILPDMVFKADIDGKYLEIYGNPSAFFSSDRNLIGKSINEFLPEELASKAIDHIRKAIETDKIEQFEYEINREDTGTRYFESRFISLNKREALCIIRDITNATQAQKQIRVGEKKLLSALENEKKLLSKINEQQMLQLEAIVNTEEKERKRIAADLHDGIGQLLSSVKINLGVASENVKKEKWEETIHLVEKSRDYIDQITKELRNISYNLLPPSLEQFGLASAIGEEVNKLLINDGLFIHFDNSTNQVRFDQKIEVILFRVFQEMLNNSLKHSKASEITIQLVQHDNQLIMVMEDNGTGFEIEQGLGKKDSSGLKNLYSRIALIQGKINLESEPNAGTSIIIEIPL